MKILMLGLSILRHAFEELGHDVLTCPTTANGELWVPEFPISIERVLQRLPVGWNPDLVILTDESTHPLVLGLERLDIPVAWYAIDSHLHMRWHQAYAAVFDMIFVAQRDFVPRYLSNPSRQVAKWLPLFCSSVSSDAVPVQKKHNLSFVGTVDRHVNPKRYRLLEQVNEQVPVHIATGDFTSVYRESKMVLNQCVDNDVNFRTFEAMACGSLLLMERVGNGLEQLFQAGTHCAMYEKDDISQIVELARYYLEHDDERETLAWQGYREVSMHHQAIHRAQTICETFAGMDQQSVIATRRAQQGEILYLLAAVYSYVGTCYANSASRNGHDSNLGRRRLAMAECYHHVSEQIHHELHL